MLSAALELTHCANVFLVSAGFVFNIVVLADSSSQSVSHLTDIVYMALFSALEHTHCAHVFLV